MKTLKRNLIIILALLASSAFPALGQKHEKVEKLAITQVLISQQNRWNNGDIDGFMKGYWNSPKLKFVSKNGVKHGWQTVLDNYKKNYDTKEKMGELVFDILSTEMLNKQSAIVIGKWKVITTTKTSEGYFSLWFKKIEGKWLIVLDHTS